MTMRGELGAVLGDGLGERSAAFDRAARAMPAGQFTLGPSHDLQSSLGCTLVLDLGLTEEATCNGSRSGRPLFDFLLRFCMHIHISM